MKPLLINLILCIFLISCASSNTYMKKYKDYSCEQIQKESDDILRGRGVYPKTRSLIIQVDLPCLNASS